ncbi:MAG TPA: hypothetical protein VFA70_07170, partial [Dehalococcoidia bacterium]|nr:hypothetical protein [Dehalococcoidia bacterium]
MRKRERAAALALAGAGATAAALHLLAHRAVDRFEDLDPETVDIPGQRFWIRGLAVHYRERGQGFPVVLVHGFAAS